MAETFKYEDWYHLLSEWSDEYDYTFPSKLKEHISHHLASMHLITVEVYKFKLLHDGGCKCEKPLLGSHEGTIRCRLCNVEVPYKSFT